MTDVITKSVIGAEVKIRNLKRLTTGGKEGTIKSYDDKIGKYCIDFHNGFHGWYHLEDFWVRNLFTGKWSKYER